MRVLLGNPKDITALETVQRKATRLLQSDRLKSLDLPSLYYRRLR